MKKLCMAILMGIVFLLPKISYAMPPTDKAAHFGVSYMLSDQLKRHTKMTTLERIGTVLAIGYAKEQWIDSNFDKNDFAADMAGVLFYEVHF